MSAPENLKSCAEIAPLLVFYACDEVAAEERIQIEAHLATCKECSAQFAEESGFQETLSNMPQAAEQLDSAGILLSQCRSELAEKLDDLSQPPLREHWQPFRWMRRWMALRPVWSAVLLVLFGLLLGARTSPWLPGRNDANAVDQAVSVRPQPRFTEDQLSKMDVAGIINLSPASGAALGTVQVQLRAEQPLLLTGNVDDTDVRRVLTYVVANGERFDPGVRLDCMDVLKARTKDLEVRSALLAAARQDQNPAVRLKALESLRDAASDKTVRDALLEALERDQNSGVRVEAVNLLVRSLEREALESPEAPQDSEVDSSHVDPSVDRVIRVLEGLQRRDPSRYVRLRSAAALRQIGPREVQ